MLLNLSRPMLTVGLPFLTVCFVASFCSFEGVIIIAVMLVICLLICLLTIEKSGRLAVVVALLSAITGAVCYNYKMTAEYEPIQTLADKTVLLQGVVTDIDETGSYCYTFNVTDHDVLGVPKRFTTNLYAPVSLDVDIYDRVTVSANFFTVDGSPGFDTGKYYRQNGIYIFAYADNKTIQIDSPIKKPIAYHFKQFNKKLCTITDRYMSGQSAAIVKAMVLGNDDDMLKITDHNLANAGVIHVTAISGLHVLIASAFFLMLCRGLRINGQIAGILSIIVVWGFVALTNFHHSTVRAGIMITLPAIGSVFGRPADGVNSLFLAGVIIAMTNPFAVTDVGFMMTFLATFGIILLQSRIANVLITRRGIKNKWRKSCLELFAITFSANLLLLPVMFPVFKGISIIAPISNLIATPITSLILLFSFIMLMLGLFPPFSPFAEAAAELNTLFVEVLLKSAEFFSELPFAYLGLNYPYARVWLILCVCAVLITLYLKKELLAKAVCISLAGLVVLVTANGVIVANTVEIITVNTGKGQAVVLIYENTATVIAMQTDDYLGYEIVRLLESKNVGRIETLVLAESDTGDVLPIEYLNAICPISRILLERTNAFVDYAHQSMSKRIGLFDINVDFRSRVTDDMKIYVKNFTDGRSIFVEIRGFSLCITDSPQIAERSNCEFLYFLEKSCEQIEHFPANYVILLRDCETGKHDNKNNVFQAYDDVMSLRVNNSGKFTLRRE